MNSHIALAYLERASVARRRWLPTSDKELQSNGNIYIKIKELQF